MAVVIPTNVPNPPAVTPGEGTTKFNHAGCYAAKSQDVNFGDTSPAQLFSVPSNCLVVDIILQIVTAFDGTGAALTLGDGTDADGFMDSTQAAPATVGFKSIKQDTQPFSGGKLYTAGDTIDAAITAGSTPTTGTFRAWLIFKPLDGEPL